MVRVSTYWQFVRIDAVGRVKIEEVSAAKAFFLQQFPDLTRHAEILDIQIQRNLWELWQGEKIVSEVTEPMETPGILAEYCLRCFISHQILETCKKIESTFGQTHKFNCNDLLPLVLDDSNPEQKYSSSTAAYQSLSAKILESFDPSKSSLTTWVSRSVRRHPALNSFLLEHGVYLASDWAILNDTPLPQLQRILTDYLPRSELEQQRTCALLGAFHAVYRRDRVQQRQSGRGSRCVPPTNEQLQKMAMHLEEQAALNLSPGQVIQELRSLALLLRGYRIYSRSGHVTAALAVTERQDDESSINDIIDYRSISDAEEELQHEQFLLRYQHLFVQSLDQVIAEVICHRVNRLSLKKQPQDQTYLKALYLFFCCGQSMGEIARAIGITAQYQVTRLLMLKALRADIRQELLKILPGRVLEEARQFVSPECCNALSRNIKIALEEQVAEMFQQAEAEAMSPGKRTVNSLFSSRMCHYLKEVRNQSSLNKELLHEVD